MHSNGHSHIHSKNKENSHSHSHLKDKNSFDKQILTNKASTDDLNNIELANVKNKRKKSKLSLNIRGVLLHVLADALGSVSVIFSSLLVKYLPSSKENEFQWKLIIDPFLSLIISFFIIISTIPVLRESSLILLQAIPRGINFQQLKNDICKINSVQRIESFHVWSLNSECLVASVNLIVARLENIDQMNVFDSVQKVLKNNNISLSSIQIRIDSKNSMSVISNLSNSASNLSLNKLRNDQNEIVILDLSKNIEL